LQNLADIAGYKFEHIQDTIYSNNFNIHRNLSSILSENFTDLNSTVTYTRYIEMAYAEVQTMLKNDKQTLIEVIRNIKTNELKLKELEKLKMKVSESLNRLNDFEHKLVNMIKHDEQIKTTVNQLDTNIKLSTDFKLDNNKQTIRINSKKESN